MNISIRTATRLLVPFACAAALLGGCASDPQPLLTATVAPPAPPPPVPTIVTYPEGRYQLYGDGAATPYYWVWIPANLTPPAPPAPPRAGVTSYPNGRYQLYGDGSTTPHYWVWIPAGSTAFTPPPPPPPRRF